VTRPTATQILSTESQPNSEQGVLVTTWQSGQPHHERVETGRRDHTSATKAAQHSTDEHGHPNIQVAGPKGGSEAMSHGRHTESGFAPLDVRVDLTLETPCAGHE